MPTDIDAGGQTAPSTTRRDQLARWGVLVWSGLMTPGLIGVTTWPGHLIVLGAWAVAGSMLLGADRPRVRGVGLVSAGLVLALWSWMLLADGGSPSMLLVLSAWGVMSWGVVWMAIAVTALLVVRAAGLLPSRTTEVAPAPTYPAPGP